MTWGEMRQPTNAENVDRSAAPGTCGTVRKNETPIARAFRRSWNILCAGCKRFWGRRSQRVGGWILAAAANGARWVRAEK